MTASKFLPVILSSFLAVQSAAGQEAHQHHRPDVDVKGQVSFPITCHSDVQATFNRAVAMLHSFGYADARRAFLEVAERDDRCGMAWWGVAMTYFHQYWDQPTPSELQAGRAAAEKAMALGGTTDRERAYITAIGRFYSDTDRLDHRTRALAYMTAMKQLAADFPDDHEASVFYSLSLLATRRPDDTTYAVQREAGEILNRLLTHHPEHPGIVHYIIHTFDHAGLADVALPAARVYAKIAPASPHALHMPSHIFTRLGHWEESIASNRDVARVAREQVALTHPGAVAYENLHANDYLVYAYLQLGDDEQARAVLEEMARAKRFDNPNFAVAYALVSAPARYAVERRDWHAAAALSLPDVDLKWENFPYARGNTWYANAIGAARVGDLATARRALDQLTKLQASLAAAPPRGAHNWAGEVEAMRLAAAGWLAHAEGRTEVAVRFLAEASELEEKVGKHPVTPGPILPAREQLGDLLLMLGRATPALAAYETALQASPKRLNALAGAAQAAELSGDRERARMYRDEFAKQCRAPVCRRSVATSAAALRGGR